MLLFAIIYMYTGPLGEKVGYLSDDVEDAPAVTINRLHI